MPIIPENFDGSKFMQKFGVTQYDFYVSGNLLFCPTIPNLTDSDLADCVVDLIAYNQQRAEDESNRAQIKTEYTSTINTLEQIENAQSPTNAEVLQAIKFLARTIKLILKLFAKQYIG